MLLIDLQNNYYSASSLYAIIAQIAMMMIDRYFYLKVNKIFLFDIGSSVGEDHLPLFIFLVYHYLSVLCDSIYNKYFFLE